jgi:hypothetical protein
MKMAELDDDAILSVVRSLARPHASGGTVIERAAIMASGADAAAIEAWIIARAGHAEERIERKQASGGLHGGSRGRPSTVDTQPRRFVLPPGVV